MIGEKVVNLKNWNLTVVGSGYVGLPTAALFATAGFNVTAVDINSKIVDSINCGTSPIDEPGLQELVSSNVQSGKLNAILAADMTFNQDDVIILSVQTPIVKHSKKPNLSFLLNALETVGKNLKERMLIVICSTIPPGTIYTEVKPFLESLSGLKAEIDFYLAYVPERIAPGKAIQEFVESPRLVGGIGPKSTKIAAQLFRVICKKIIETDVATAEIAKTAENTFRDVNIAFANQLALICEQHGADVIRVIELANTHPRVNIHSSGPGVGGPCLTKDPYLLTHKSKHKDCNLIIVARKINDSMSKHIVNLVIKSLKNVNKDVRSSKISILGTAYKANVGDSRFAPSELIIQMLANLGAKIIVYDPYCDDTFGASKALSIQDCVLAADCVVTVTDHTDFRSLNLLEIKELMESKPIIVDGKRIIDPKEAEKNGFIYRGIGYSGN